MLFPEYDHPLSSNSRSARIICLLLFEGARLNGVFSKTAKTTTVTHLGLGRFREIPFPLPDASTRRRLSNRFRQLLDSRRRIEHRLSASRTLNMRVLARSLHRSPQSTLPDPTAFCASANGRTATSPSAYDRSDRPRSLAGAAIRNLTTLYAGPPWKSHRFSKRKACCRRSHERHGDGLSRQPDSAALVVSGRGIGCAGRGVDSVFAVGGLFFGRNVRPQLLAHTGTAGRCGRQACRSCRPFRRVRFRSRDGTPPTPEILRATLLSNPHSARRGSSVRQRKRSSNRRSKILVRNPRLSSHALHTRVLNRPRAALVKSRPVSTFSGST